METLHVGAFSTCVRQPDRHEMNDHTKALESELKQRQLARDAKMAMDPPVSEAQRKAMFAAAEGKSTLGIPKKVGEKFVGKA